MYCSHDLATSPPRNTSSTVRQAPRYIRTRDSDPNISFIFCQACAAILGSLAYTGWSTGKEGCCTPHHPCIPLTCPGAWRCNSVCLYCERVSSLRQRHRFKRKQKGQTISPLYLDCMRPHGIKVKNHDFFLLVRNICFLKSFTACTGQHSSTHQALSVARRHSIGQPCWQMSDAA